MCVRTLQLYYMSTIFSLKAFEKWRSTIYQKTISANKFSMKLLNLITYIPPHQMGCGTPMEC